MIEDAAQALISDNGGEPPPPHFGSSHKMQLYKAHPHLSVFTTVKI